LPEPGEASGDPGAKTAALKNAILERGMALESVDDLDGALGTSSDGCIRLLNGPSPATEFTTLVHEYAHLCPAVGYVRGGSRRAPCAHGSGLTGLCEVDEPPPFLAQAVRVEGVVREAHRRGPNEWRSAKPKTASAKLR
jgi:hypothetical protein